MALENGIPLYEKLGPAFTMLAIGGADAGSIAQDAARAGVPLEVLRIDQKFLPVYERRLLLVRPDHHVAWRGDEPLEDWQGVLALATGRVLQPA